MAPTPPLDQTAREPPPARGDQPALLGTGTGEAALAEAGRAAAALQATSGVPVAVGSGVDSPEKARLGASAGAAGVVVGTALVRRVAEGATTEERCAAVAELVGALRRGLDA